MNGFFRFPHTPHLAWLGLGQPRNDKLLTAAEAASLLDGPVVVEEKVDGANIGLSITPGGELCVQNRGHYLRPDEGHPQFSSLWSWLSPRRSHIMSVLSPDTLLFGEWCAAVHSVEYDRLPDWFLGFDVYDREDGVFWDTAHRDHLLNELGLQSVPQLAVGVYTLSELESLLNGSRIGSAPMEGLVVRKEKGGLIELRAKLVQAEFAQSIDQHWSRKPLQRNRLARGTHT